MKQLRAFYILLLLLLLFSGNSSIADQVHLWDGSILEGRITVLGDKRIALKQKLPNGDSVDKILLQDDIARIFKDPPEIADFKELPEDVSASKFSLKVDQYNIAISNQFLPYLKKFPTSKSIPVVRQRIESAVKERDLVTAGNIKFNGTWCAAKQIQRRLTDLYSYEIYQSIIQSRQKQNFAEVLTQWNSFQTKFPGSLLTPATIDLVITSLNGQQAQIERDIHSKESAQSTEAGSDHALVELNKTEIARLQEMKKKILEKISGLKNLPEKSLMEKSIMDTEKAEKLLDTGKLDSSAGILKTALAAWNENHLAKTLQTELDDLRRKMGEKRKIYVQAQERGDFLEAIKYAQIFLKEFPEDQSARTLISDDESAMEISKKLCAEAASNLEARKFMKARVTCKNSLEKWPENIPAKDLQKQIEASFPFYVETLYGIPIWGWGVGIFALVLIAGVVRARST